MVSFPLAPLLPDDVLAKQGLAVKFAPVTLSGQYVRLQPLDLERDADALFAVSNGEPLSIGGRSTQAYDADERIWRYMAGGPFATAADLADYLRPQVDNPNGLALCVFDLASGHQVGVATYMNNFPQHLKIELGNIWYSPLVQRSHANTEATYLMLKHAFGLGYRRVEWKCDALNQRSRKAALRLGFSFEGVQAYHFIVKGRNRDTAWYRILDKEWPRVRQQLEARLHHSA